MKQLIYMFFILTALTFFVSCSKDSDDDSGSETPAEKKDTTHTTVPDSITKPDEKTPLDSIGNDSKPTDWVAITNTDPTVFMTVTIDSTGTPAAISSDDMLAAFVGDECRGVSTPHLDADGVTRFSFVIVACAETTDGNKLEQVELRYYSKTKTRIYKSDKFDFTPGQKFGSIYAGYEPTWK